MLHLEFVVPGPPISYQTRDKANLRMWQATIQLEARKVWTAEPLTVRLKLLAINFFEGDRPPLDDDNMIKPIRDALNAVVYVDDRQIQHSETIQMSIDAPVRIRRASRIITDAFHRGDEFLYVRIEDIPDLIQLPR
jgi:Holliday junction resolvase RusA-like endonuclease